MREFPLISIIIPAYNRAGWLIKYLESIRTQEYENYEIIIIDDCSSEDLKVLSSPHLRYIRNDINMGPSYSKNLGALNSKGEILLFLDSDVQLLPGSLKNLPRIFSGDPLIGGVGGVGPPNDTATDVAHIWLSSYDRLGRKTMRKCYPSEEPPGSELHDVDIAASAFLAVPRDTFFRLGGFDPYFYYMGEDRDLCFDLKEHGYRLVVSPDTRAIHFRMKEGNEWRAKNAEQERTLCLEKYLEVAIKRRGVLGGIVWMIGNAGSALRAARFFRLLNVFKKRKDLIRRRKINHLAPGPMADYRLTRLKDRLESGLSFPVSFPLPAPGRIVLFVTSRCNALCDHCFISGVPKGKAEITADNIVKLAGSMKRPVSLTLTGGEPFLRDDLEMILRGLMELEQISAISIPTNGSFPERIAAVCENICGGYKKPLHIQISLDGPEKIHDSIRKTPGGFKKAVETCERLSSIKQANPHFSFMVNTTLMKANLPGIEEFVEWMRKQQYPGKLSLVRGNSFSTFNVPGALLNTGYGPRRDVAPAAGEIRRALEAIGQKHPAYFNALQKRKLAVMLDTSELKKRQIPCYAGFEDAVVYSDGSVALCEQTIAFGNLADWDWDLVKAWNSKEAMEHRVQLLSCACIHGCNIGTSIAKQGL